ncbi:MAG: lysophospholipid acyltransferase family protein [Planctomycetota bacterium]
MSLPAGYRLSLRAARLVADTTRLAWPRLRATVRENIRIAYGDADEALVRAVYRHFGSALADLAWYDRLFHPDRVREHFDIEGPGWEHYETHGKDGCVCVTGHFGNWELFGAVFHYLGIPVAAVMRPPDTPWFRRRIARLRTEFKIEMIDKKNALPLAMKAVRRGRAVVFLNDQAAGRHGIPLPFLGQDAWTFTAPAALAKKLQVPLYAGYSTRLGDGIRYRCWTEPVSIDGDVESITRRLNERLEEYVRAAPEQWWWFHKRFKPPKSQRRGRKLTPAGVPVPGGDS